MRLNTSTPALFAFSSLFCLGSSLPFFHRKIALLEPFARRATYSVVAVDGGSATAAQNDVTVVETILHTPAPTTKTIVETDTIPPVTDYIISTKTIEGPKTTQTVVVTVTPTTTAVTITTVGYSIIDVKPPPVTVTVNASPSASPKSDSTASSPESKPSSAELKPLTSQSTSTSTPTSSLTSQSSSVSSTPFSLGENSSGQQTSAPEASSSSLSSSGAVTSTMTSLQTQASSVSSSPSSTPSPIESPSTSTSSSSSASLSTTLQTSTFSSIVPSSTPAAFDNGQWHTTYPTWSNATGTPTKFATIVQTSTGVMPTLSAVSTNDVPENSVPGVFGTLLRFLHKL